MIPIDDLPNIDSNACTKLKLAKIKTVEDLWEKIGDDFENGLAKVSNEANVDHKHLIEILAEGESWAKPPQVSSSVKGEKPRPPRVSVGEVILALGLVSFVVLFLFRAISAFGLLPTYMKPASSAVDQVVAITGLPAFHLIERGEVQLAKKTRTANVFLQIDEVVGRYPLEPLGSGEIIRKDQLSSVHLSAADMANRWILSVPLAAGTFNAAIVQGARVTLLFAPQNADGKNPPASVKAEAIIVAIHEDKGAVLITAAIDQTKRDEVGDNLGTSKVFIMQSIP